MALPIAPTPILRGRDARKFDERIMEDLKKPTSLIATPKLEEARRLAIQYADNKGIDQFVSLFLRESQDLDPKYSKVVDKYFWDLA